LDDKWDGHDLPNGEAPLTALCSPSSAYVFPAVYQHCGVGDYNIHRIRKYTQLKNKKKKPQRLLAVQDSCMKME